MMVSIIGTGNIGGRLARRFASHGVDVTVASHDLAKAQALADEAGEHVSAASVDDAMAKNDMIVFATWFATTKELLEQHRSQLSGKLVVDPSNNISFNDSGEASNENPEGVSSGQQLSKLVGDASYVKAFGSMAAEQLEQETLDGGEKVVMFYASDDDAAASKVAELINAAGWDAVKAGGVDDTARIEVFGELHPFGQLNGKLLSRAEAEKLV